MTLDSRPAPAAISGFRVAVLVVLILFATAVVPPFAAARLNRTRVERGWADVHRIAGDLRAREASLRTLTAGSYVVCGTGRLPTAAPAGRGWLDSPTTIDDVFGAARPRDPWGRCYLTNPGALASRRPVVILSAGPNGLIDTPLDASRPDGDDIGVRIW